jgi:predicted RNA binding protein YcfA (HicA-like mRNA interferase family)
VKVLEGLGWEVARRRGSHIVLVRDGSLASLPVPDHQQVAKGTLRSLIRAADLTRLGVHRCGEGAVATELAGGSATTALRYVCAPARAPVILSTTVLSTTQGITSRSPAHETATYANPQAIRNGCPERIIRVP